MSNFNVTIDETNNQVTVLGDGTQILLVSQGVQGPAGTTDHGALSGLSDDDHPQYHNNARALTWLGTRSTSDLPEGTNKYYTAAQARSDIVTSSITNSDTTHAPSGDAVFDALALKANTSSLATVATTGAHSDLIGVGSNTHAQIDTALTAAAAHAANTSNPHTVTKAQVGLSNVDNTSDVNKPISTATQTALDLKVDENSPITGATKTKITYDTKGLVTSGADATTADIADSSNKRYVTDAQLVVIGNTSGTNTGDQTASTVSNTPAGNISATTVQGAINELDSEKQPLDAQLTDLAGLSYSGNASKVIRVNAGETGFELVTPSSGVTDHTLLSNIGTNTHAQIDTHIASTSNPHSVTASQVGLGNVDNTSDVNKPVSTAQQTAIDAKVSDTAYNATSWDAVTTIAPSKNAVRDKIESLASSIVTDHTALSNIGTNTHAQIDTHIANTSNPHSVTKSQVGLGNVDNTSDANKPVSTAQQTAIDAKVSDTAYNASSWDAVTTIAPSKNTVRDQIETMLTSISGVVIDSIADADTTHAPSRNAVFDALALKEDTSNKDNGALSSSTSTFPTSGAVKTYADAKVSDTAYDATSWDSVTTIAPSKNAVRDKIQTLMPLAGGTFTGAVIESVVTLTDAATISVDATLGNIFTVTLGGNRTLGNPTGAVNGQKLVFRIRQDATGSRTLAFDTKFRFGTDVASPTLTTTAAKTDYIGCIYHSGDDKFDVLAVVKGL